MSGHADEIRQLLEPVVRDAQVDMGPVLWQRLKDAAEQVYAACEHEDEEASVSTDLMHELMNEVEDR